MQRIFFLCASSSILAVVCICVYLFANGLPAIWQIGPVQFLTGLEWKPSQGLYGIWPMIVGTLYSTLGAALIGIPVGVLTAVFLVWYCPEKLYKILKPGIELMAGIPSIVYGFFGLSLLVPLLQNLFPGTSGKGVLCASLLLGIMILPTIVSVSETSLRAVDPAYYEGSLALGASKERTIFKICLPAAFSGVLAGIILGIGRALGETMAVVMVAGNSAILPSGILSNVRTLTGNIVLEMSYATGLHRQALIASAVVLFGMILLMNFGFSRLKKKVQA